MFLFGSFLQFVCDVKGIKGPSPKKKNLELKYAFSTSKICLSIHVFTIVVCRPSFESKRGS